MTERVENRISRKIMNVFFINLDRSDIRKDYMLRHFEKHGIKNVRRWSATDAASPDFERPKGYKPGHGRRWELTQSALATFESHRLLWAHIAQGTEPYGVVFEDDVLLMPSASERISTLVQHCDEFDVIRLDTTPQKMYLGPLQDIGNVQVRPMLQTTASAAAYILSRSACQRLLNEAELYSDHLDDFLFTPREGLRVYQLCPAIGIQHVWAPGQADETPPAEITRSERLADPKVNKPTNKGPLGFRLKKEGNRLLTRRIYAKSREKKVLSEGGFVGAMPLEGAPSDT